MPQKTLVLHTKTLNYPILPNEFVVEHSLGTTGVMTDQTPQFLSSYICTYHLLSPLVQVKICREICHFL